MGMDGYRRRFMSLLGFDTPDDSLVSPSGRDVRPAVIEPTAPVGMSFVKANPNNGVLMHNHDTNENFLVIEGRWEISWEGADGTQSVLLGPLDFIAIPPFVHRRFECVEAAPGKLDGMMLGIIGAKSVSGTPAGVEYSPEAVAAIAAASVSIPGP
jgi:mannose-6-phosphate isomerase-like protein (cupin superfamily)